MLRFSANIFSLVIWLFTLFKLSELIFKVVTSGPYDLRIFGLPLQQWPESLAPIAIVLLSAWLALVEIPGHALRVWKENRSLRQATAQLPVQALTLRIGLDTRIGRRLDMLRGQPSQVPIGDRLDAISSLDEAEFSNRYGATRAYIWVLPVIGFIGTALGMAEAISGFKEALTRSNEIGQLAESLGSTVIPGLTGAFHVTMLALGAAIAAHLWSVAIETWDQQTLDDSDRLCHSIISALPAQDSKEASALRQCAGTLVEIRNVLYPFIGAASATLKSSPERSEEHLKRTLDALGGLKLSNESYLEDAIKSFARFAETFSSIEQKLQSMTIDLERISPAFSNARESGAEFLRALEAIATNLSALGREVKLTDASQALDAAAVRLNGAAERTLTAATELQASVTIPYNVKITRGE